MECILQRIGPSGFLRIAPVGIPCPTDMQGTIEEPILLAVEAILMSHLDDVCLAAFRPAHLVEVITHLPESRPEAISGTRELDSCVNATEGVVHLVLAVHTTGRAFAVNIVLLGGR